MFSALHRRSHSIGQFVGDKSFERYSGYGRLELEDGIYYDGEFHNGQFHGTGTLHLADGRMEGVWLNGVVSREILIQF